ncbi:MAG: PatB family C-S lyase [Chloroflexia bacterium]|nr:PatB family C-S lyase [Chloroflexia bacterium]
MPVPDFDQLLDLPRFGDSVKWCLFEEGMLPLWVADMDFHSPAPVIRALVERASHGVFGYALSPGELRQVIQERLARLYDWQVQEEDIFFLPGVVTGFNMACHAVGKPGDEILVEVPVYFPMLDAPGNAGRVCRMVSLLEEEGYYRRDEQTFEAAIGPRTSLFLLCNPHNPVGRAFGRAELERLAEICLRHDVVICSDEIHCDIVFPGHPHTPIASLAPEIAARTITLLAPSKTFNVPGLSCSVAVVQDADLRERVRGAGAGLVSHVNVMGYTAALAAYRDGGPWLEALLRYLEDNCDYLLDYVARHMPLIRCRKPEATFLAWLDCRQAGLPGNPQRFFEEYARVCLNDGAIFGPGGEGFLRLNFACPRATLQRALERMRQAYERRAELAPVPVPEASEPK